MAYVAARTKRVMLCTGVAILPYRHPLLTAKIVATIDRLSGGRVMFGAGVGGLE
jgi:alkanesulfonate monooxygenase SsuD/methylene tetrahydromethanopterin reductase-like flavin-dependent oxidoreductase (luciferase family)